MQGVTSIISVMSALVAQMTPIYTITANIEDGNNWKLSACNTYWLNPGTKVTIDNIEYEIVSFVQNDHIIVSGASQPVVTFFQLAAPVFQHGSHRKVSGERKSPTDLTKPLVYLPVPEVDEDETFDSDIAYTADIKPLFLLENDPDREDIDAQQIDVIEPANAMADFFIELILDQGGNFNRPDSVKRKEWQDFGNQTIWGSDKRIFNQNLSGVEAKLLLEVVIDALCLCDDAPIVTCLPVNIIINGVQFSVVPSGQDGIVVVKDTDGLSVGVLIAGEWIVPAAGGNPANILLGGVSFGTIPAGGSKDIAIEDTAANGVGTKVNDLLMRIADGTITINTVPVATILAEGSKALEVVDIATGLPVGAFGLLSQKWEITFPTLLTTALLTTGQENSFRTGDDGDRFLNGDYASANAADIIDFYKLVDNNEWGHKKRLTGKTGGFMDEATGSFFDFDGTPSNKATAFPDNILRDYAWRRQWYLLRSGARSWNDCITLTLTESRGGEVGWFCPNKAEYESLTSNSANSPTYVDSRLFNWSANNMWSSTTHKLNTVRAHRIGTNADSWTDQAKTQSNANAYIKIF